MQKLKEAILTKHKEVYRELTEAGVATIDDKGYHAFINGFINTLFNSFDTIEDLVFYLSKVSIQGFLEKDLSKEEKGKVELASEEATAQLKTLDKIKNIKDFSDLS